MKSETTELLSHAATVIPCNEMKESLNFYQSVLGFSLTFTRGDPVSYAVLNRGEVRIHLTKRDQRKTEPEARLYVFVHDIEVLHREISAKSPVSVSELADREYGMRDFDVIDPGNIRITFGQGFDGVEKFAGPPP